MFIQYDDTIDKILADKSYRDNHEKVIAGEQGGVSKALGWQGGGEFMYVECGL